MPPAQNPELPYPVTWCPVLRVRLMASQPGSTQTPLQTSLVLTLPVRWVCPLCYRLKVLCLPLLFVNGYRRVGKHDDCL
jgi:hypothetical protein